MTLSVVSDQQKLFWSECTTGCCRKATSVVKAHVDSLDRSEYSSLVCFDVNFTSGSPEQKYVFLTSFNTAYSYYLSMAFKFLGDVGARHALSGEVVWRIEDDATIIPSLQVNFSSVGVAHVGHSVHRVRGIPSLYTTLVPNFHFIQHDGYSVLTKYAATLPSHFKSLKTSVFWTGSSTGYPCQGKQPCDMTCEHLQRIRLVQLAQQVEWLKCYITKAIHWCAAREETLVSSGMLLPRSEEVEWMEYRGVIDIDGYVDAWGSYWRYASRSVVFKVESDYVNMFSNILLDGVHYIGLNASLSDLLSKTSLITSNDTDTLKHLENITENARRSVTAVTYYSEVERVAQVLMTFFDQKEMTNQLDILPRIREENMSL